MSDAAGSISPLPIKAFLSYSRRDDQDFSVVEPYVGKLRALVLAKSGRELEIFVDQVDIEWGADWQHKLADAVFRRHWFSYRYSRPIMSLAKIAVMSSLPFTIRQRFSG